MFKKRKDSCVIGPKNTKSGLSTCFPSSLFKLQLHRFSHLRPWYFWLLDVGRASHWQNLQPNVHTNATSLEFFPAHGTYATGSRDARSGLTHHPPRRNGTSRLKMSKRKTRWWVSSVLPCGSPPSVPCISGAEGGRPRSAIRCRGPRPCVSGSR